MSKFYIHQLLDGEMLVFEDCSISKESTGYPLPDCSILVGSKEYKGQEQVIRALLGYPIESHSDFAKVFSSIDKMDYDSFKLKVQSENIGGGCPERIQIIARDCIDNGIDYVQSIFKHLLPEQFINSDCILPESSDIIEEYNNIIYQNLICKVNKPNSKFRNNIIMYLGIKHFSDKYIELFKDVLSICIRQEYSDIFKYISVITAENGVSAILVADSVLCNIDLEYFYSTIAGIDLADGIIIVTDTEEGIEVSFNCVDKSLSDYYKDKKPFMGSVKHFEL